MPRWSFWTVTSSNCLKWAWSVALMSSHQRKKEVSGLVGRCLGRKEKSSSSFFITENVSSLSSFVKGGEESGARFTKFSQSVIINCHYKLLFFGPNDIRWTTLGQALLEIDTGTLQAPVAQILHRPVASVLISFFSLPPLETSSTSFVQIAGSQQSRWVIVLRDRE